jgi:hypothetical protein
MRKYRSKRTRCGNYRPYKNARGQYVNGLGERIYYPKAYFKAVCENRYRFISKRRKK